MLDNQQRIINMGANELTKIDCAEASNKITTMSAIRARAEVLENLAWMFAPYGIDAKTPKEVPDGEDSR